MFQRGSVSRDTISLGFLKQSNTDLRAKVDRGYLYHKKKQLHVQIVHVLNNHSNILLLLLLLLPSIANQM